MKWQWNFSQIKQQRSSKRSREKLQQCVNRLIQSVMNKYTLTWMLCPNDNITNIIMTRLIMPFNVTWCCSIKILWMKFIFLFYTVDAVRIISFVHFPIFFSSLSFDDKKHHKRSRWDSIRDCHMMMHCKIGRKSKTKQLSNDF